MKITYGGDADKISAEDFARFVMMDTYYSDDETNAIDTNNDGISDHDGILDSDRGEFDINFAGDLLAVLSGRGPSIGAADTASKKAVSARVYQVTPNGKTYSDGIVDILGGQFEMGSVDGDSDERKSDGTTVNVTMSDFKLAKSEVTVGQYKTYLVEIGDSQYAKLPDVFENKKGDNFPVVGLTYDEMMAFCQYYGGTLPTAAQIEYASKGSSHTDSYGTPLARAAIYDNAFRTEAEVCGTNNQRANDYGVCDLAGNVWEMTLDQYDKNFYDRMATKDPSNPVTNSATQRVELRGGFWGNSDRDVRSASRSDGFATTRYLNVGFRVAWPSS